MLGRGCGRDMIGDLIGGLVGSLLRGLVCGLLGSLVVISYFSREGTGNPSDDVRSTSRLCAVLHFSVWRAEASTIVATQTVPSWLF